MKLLAMDTSSVACSVAMTVGKTVIERHEEQPREHTRILLPMIRSVLAEAGIGVEELDAIVLGNGPGSFIGMRIAASVAQGLAYGAGIGIVPVSSLAAVAARVFAEEDAAEVVVTQDAHMNQAYLGIYRRDSRFVVAEVDAERLCAVAPIPELNRDAAGRRVAAGYGWQRYPDLYTANRERLDALSANLYPRARFLVAIGAPRFSQDGGLNPSAISPAYLRAKVAEKPARLP